jgi:CPA1 family monovalent cation:H+ antiporter
MNHGLASESVTTLVWLLIAIMAVAVASKYIRLPYTVALTIAGLIIALSPIDLTVNLTPDLILFIFLPALLFESAYNLHFADVRDNLRPITFLAVPGVILTAIGVAAIIHYAVDVTWETAFLFGAIMSATDPVSVLAIFRQIGAPRRLAVILEGESLFNDGTSLVVFRIVLGIVVATVASDFFSAAEQFLWVVLGGLVLGVLVGYGISLLLSRVNDYLVETAMTLLVAYGAYLLAERINVSGVIAVVVAGLIVGNYGRNVAMSPTTRLAVSSTWEFFGFLANSLIFLLIGLELNVEKLAQFWLPTLVAIASVLIVRIVVVVISSAVLRFIHRPIPYSWQVVLVWGGLRGSVALAMALSLPFTMASGAPFPSRDLLLIMTFGVILFSLLVQALTMSPLLRRLGITDSAGRQDELEIIRVRKAMAAAAIAEIDSIAKQGGLSPETVAELRHAYAMQIEELDKNLQALHLRDEDLRDAHVRSVKRHLLHTEKTILQQSYHDGTISNAPMRRLMDELNSQLHDLDEGNVSPSEAFPPAPEEPPETPSPARESQAQL